MSNLTADHGAMKMGRRESVPAQLARVPMLRAFLGPELPEPPPLIDYLSGMSRIDMLGNNRYGDCMYAALAHDFQAKTAAMGRERVFSEAETLAMYGRDTGFREDDPGTDQGANMFEALSLVRERGFCELEIEGFARVDATNHLACHQALWLFGGVLWGVALPLVAQRQKRWRLEMGAGDAQLEPAGWGRHAVSQPYSILGADGRPLEKITTWGAPKEVEETYRDAPYLEEVYVVFMKGWTPPSVPGFDRDGLLAAMRSLRS